MNQSTPPKSPAWWVWLQAAVFVLYFGLVLRNDWAGPGLGLHAVYQDGGMVVQDSVIPSELIEPKPEDYHRSRCSRERRALRRVAGTPNSSKRCAPDVPTQTACSFREEFREGTPFHLRRRLQGDAVPCANGA